jgi:uncharacterized protein YwqG
MNRQELRREILSAGLESVADRLERAILPSARMRTTPVDEETLPLGVSKIGGSPDLPLDIAWPHWEGQPDATEPEACGGPLCFLAQFNLAEIIPYDDEGVLPKTGLLYFFAAIWTSAIGEFARDFPCWRVIHWDGDTADLRRAAVPPVSETVGMGNVPPNHRFTCCAVSFTPEETLPDNNDPLPYEALGMTDTESDRYSALLETMDLQSWRANGGEGEPVHRLLGYPQVVQYDMRCDAHLHAKGLDYAENDEDEVGAEKWRLLFQIDTAPSIHLTWQGWGRGYFWIHEDALQAHDFSKVWLMMQAS